MAVWVIRGGANEEEALEDGKISIDYGVSKDLKVAQTRDDVRNLVQQVRPNVDNKADWADNRPIMAFQEQY